MNSVICSIAKEGNLKFMQRKKEYYLRLYDYNFFLRKKKRLQCTTSHEMKSGTNILSKSLVGLVI